ncbi:MAG: hypothetical protein ACI4NE_06030 [Succinivibrio sp.]
MVIETILKILGMEGADPVYSKDLDCIIENLDETDADKLEKALLDNNSCEMEFISAFSQCFNITERS